MEKMRDLPAVTAVDDSDDTLDCDAGGLGR